MVFFTAPGETREHDRQIYQSNWGFAILFVHVRLRIVFRGLHRRTWIEDEATYWIYYIHILDLDMEEVLWGDKIA